MWAVPPAADDKVVVGIRKSVALLGLAVAVALIGGLAWNLVQTQEQGRLSLRDGLERRAALTGRLISAAFLANNTPESARQAFGGDQRQLRAAVRAQAQTGDGRVLILGRGGRVLASSPSKVAGGADLLAESPHLREALAGRPALSDAFVDSRGRSVVELAIPFDTPSGRRVLAGTGPVQLVQNFTGSVFESASALRGAQGYLVDGKGWTLSMTGAKAGTRLRGPSARLAAALERAANGEYGDRTFVSAPVPLSRWRVVLSVPTDQLYAAVDGGPSDAAWRLFAAFSLAIMALLGFGFVLAGGARRLAAATERERAASQLAHARLHDALTGLPGRALFQDRAEHAIEAARRSGSGTAMLFLDVDHFKRINDSLGHEGGDAVLREVAARLRSSVRAGDTVSRFGGDEFVVLCQDVDPDTALPFVCAIEQELGRPLTVGGRTVPLTFSIGVAVHRGGSDDRTAAELVRDADVAMYRAKELGRGRVEIFDGALHAQALTRLDTEVALRQAIADDELVVHYQPIVTLPEGRLCGVEALVRWRRAATGDLVPPSEFIPLAEETGLIGAIGDWVLRTAIREVGDWASRGLVDEEFRLSVNVSARQLSDPDLPQTVADALEGWDRPEGRLCLEITETAVMHDPGAAERTLEQLSELGVRLALDDFGVGHSSLGQLARALPISVLKIDRSFVAAMKGPRDRAIVEAVVALSRALDLTAVAEGVESPEQAAELTAMGVDYAQGFYFGRPAPADDMVERLRPASLA
jgi:diguanylate cyclase (GGDEF)-like protein